MNFSEILDKISTPPVPAVVVAAVAILLIAYVYISKAINSKKNAVETAKAPAAPVAPPAAPAAVSGPAAPSGDLELVGTDEKTAAVIMAIVSDKSDIPLNRLQFKSITLMEDK